MKLTLANNESIEVKRLNNSINDANTQLDITIEEVLDINEIKSLFENNTKTIKVTKDDNSEVLFEGYENISIVSRDISDFDDVVRITLTK